MRSLARWEPFGEFSSLRRAMERLFDDYAPLRWRGEEAEWGFPIDVFETEKEIVVKGALPGIKPEDVEITVTENTLTIKGETKAEEKVEKENYYRREMRWGAFARVVPLPAGAYADKAEAEFKDGVLTVTLPRAEEVRAKQIKVKTAKEAEPAGVS